MHHRSPTTLALLVTLSPWIPALAGAQTPWTDRSVDTTEDFNNALFDGATLHVVGTGGAYRVLPEGASELQQVDLGVTNDWFDVHANGGTVALAGDRLVASWDGLQLDPIVESPGSPFTPVLNTSTHVWYGAPGQFPIVGRQDPMGSLLGTVVDASVMDICPLENGTLLALRNGAIVTVRNDLAIRTVVPAPDPVLDLIFARFQECPAPMTVEEVTPRDVPRALGSRDSHLLELRPFQSSEREWSPVEEFGVEIVDARQIDAYTFVAGDDGQAGFIFSSSNGGSTFSPESLSDEIVDPRITRFEVRFSFSGSSLRGGGGPPDQMEVFAVGNDGAVFSTIRPLLRPILRDGFESGDTGAWSLTLPEAP